MGNTTIFNQMAERYDSKERSEVNQVILGQLKKGVRTENQDKVLIDYGCGTGELGLALASEFQRVLFGDTSYKMLEVVKEKLMSQGMTTAETFEIVEGEPLTVKGDVIISCQVLLHVRETKPLLKLLFDALKSGGKLIIIDFNKNQLVKSDLVHNGFNQLDLQALCHEIGFKEVQSKTFYEREKLFMNQKASMFYLEGVKS